MVAFRHKLAVHKGTASSGEASSWEEASSWGEASSSVEASSFDRVASFELKFALVYPNSSYATGEYLVSRPLLFQVMTDSFAFRAYV